jgi:putative transposase
MSMIDEQYLKTPFYGSRKMREHLRRLGYPVNRKRIQRLMQLMGIEGICPGLNLSKKAQDHKIYPYLLRNLTVERPNQVWATDITYIRLSRGFLYLVAILDWFSRYVIAWRLSNTLEGSFCLEVLEEALTKDCPDIFNSDQGCQFTRNDFTGILTSRGVKISMDGRKRALDNIFVERLWRTVKYEEVYLRGYQTGEDAFKGLGRYFPFYNNERCHQSLDYKTPAEVYFGRMDNNRLKAALYA